MPNLDGVFIPVTTPFRGDDVAPERLQANLQKWNATALAGYVVLGSTGEFPMLSEAERDRILVAAREAIPKTKAFIAGTGTNSTLHTIRQSRRAAEVGADAAIVITPHYFTKGVSQGAAQVRPYLAVAAASPIPIMIYNFPLNTLSAQHGDQSRGRDRRENRPAPERVRDQGLVWEHPTGRPDHRSDAEDLPRPGGRGVGVAPVAGDRLVGRHPRAGPHLRARILRRVRGR